MLRILLIISLVFSLSLFSNMSYVYAPCRPGHGDGGGDSGRSHSGGGGGMSGATGAAAGLGLLFNILQSTRAQEDDAAAGVDLDALATEYATAFNVIDPTAALIVLAGVPTGVDIAAANPEGKPGCSCKIDGCKCPYDDACWVQTSRSALKEWSRLAMEAPPGSEGAKWYAEAWSDEMEDLKAFEKECNKASGGSGGMVSVSGGTGVSIVEPPPEDKPVCGCGGGNCTCPEDLACGGATLVDDGMYTDEKAYYGHEEWVCGGVSSGGTGVDMATTSSENIPNCFCNGDGCTCPEDLACGGATYNETTRKFFCGGVSSGGTGVDMATTSSEDKPVCGCGGGKCKCPKKDACEVQYHRGKAREWSRKVMDKAPGMLGVTAVEFWNYHRKKSEEAEEKCK